MGEVTKIMEEEKPDEANFSSTTKRTKAELAFKKMQEKMVNNVNLLWQRIESDEIMFNI